VQRFNDIAPISKVQEVDILLQNRTALFIRATDVAELSYLILSIWIICELDHKDWTDMAIGP
jgi:hypothetical protein